LNGKKIAMMKVDKIKPNTLNPRKIFDEEELRELSLSIKKHGLIQPMRVRTKGENYEVVAGDRRFRAIKLLDMKEIPDDWVIIQSGDKSNGMVILESLSENIQRGDLSYLEVAEGLKAYKKEQEKETKKKISQQILADDFGKDQSWISRRLLIADLDKDVKDKLMHACISFYVCESWVLPLKDTQKQILFLDQIDKQMLSEAQIKKLYDVFKNTGLPELLQMYEYLPETTHSIFNNDSRKMDGVPDGSVHLIITSPPYGNIKEYSTDKKDIGNYKDDEYLKQIKSVYAECFRVLQPGRKFCLNVKDERRTGEYGVKWYLYAYRIVDLCDEIGFEVADVIIWNKPNKEEIKDELDHGSLPYPGSPLICDSIEYIFILRKPGKPNYSHLAGLAKEASVLSKEEYTEFIKQVWKISEDTRISSKEEIVFEHLASFPEELPLRLIKLYSYLTETVLDPFVGSGTTMVAAKKLGRNSIGYEINKEYVQLSKKLLES